jgi:hypothetical protein
MTFKRNKMMLTASTKRTTQPQAINVAGVIVLTFAGVAIATAIAVVVMVLIR